MGKGRLERGRTRPQQASTDNTLPPVPVFAVRRCREQECPRSGGGVAATGAGCRFLITVAA